MRKLRGLISMIRPEDGVFGAFAVWIGWVVASGNIFPRRPVPLILASLSTFFLIGALNLLNDIKDIRIDRLIHSKRALASGIFSPVFSAYYMLLLLLLSGFSAILASYLASEVLVLIIFGGGLIMGFLYEIRFKNKGYSGNLIIALMVSLPFLLGASLVSISSLIVVICIMAFLTGLAKEIINDVKDLKGDLGLRMTLPAVHGTKFSLAFAILFLSMAIGFSIIPLFIVGPNIPYMVLIGTADLILLAVMIISYKGPMLAHWLNSLGMVLSLPAFLSLSF